MRWYSESLDELLSSLAKVYCLKSQTKKIFYKQANCKAMIRRVTNYIPGVRGIFLWFLCKRVPRRIDIKKEYLSPTMIGFIVRFFRLSGPSAGEPKIRRIEFAISWISITRSYRRLNRTSTIGYSKSCPTGRKNWFSQPYLYYGLRTRWKTRSRCK